MGLYRCGLHSGQWAVLYNRGETDGVRTTTITNSPYARSVKKASSYQFWKPDETTSVDDWRAGGTFGEHELRGRARPEQCSDDGETDAVRPGVVL